MKPQLALFLLGTFQVQLDGEPVSHFEYDKVRALLAYLVVEPDFPHRRDVLTSLLWPEQTNKKARHSLSQALLTCRKSLGDRSRAIPFIVANRHTVQWNPAALPQLDVADFEALLAACANHPHPRAETCPDCMVRRQAAVALYRGDFLKGLSVGDSPAFDDWATLQRERLHRLAIEALRSLTRTHERRGQVEQARQYAQRQVELEPWRETGHRQLMRLLLYSGQRSAALAQYQSCTRILAAELGVEPSAKTQDLYALIKNADPHPPHNLPAQITPFIGRQQELVDIAGLLADPDCYLLTLVGPGGMGKTRLALAVAARQLGRPTDSPNRTSQSYAFFTHGVYFVSLTAVQTTVALVLAMADTLGLSLETDATHRPHPIRSAKQQLLDYLQQKRMLIILDNLEQLLVEDEVSEVMALLVDIRQSAPNIQLLVTSREQLRLPGGHVYTVRGLAYPEVTAFNQAEPPAISPPPSNSPLTRRESGDGRPHRRLPPVGGGIEGGNLSPSLFKRLF